MLSAICFNFDRSKILLSGNGLMYLYSFIAMVAKPSEELAKLQIFWI